mmetsp:Transcript_16059/g.49059  ORF Transcript_16059/g.49059 Transcript_16059/m.49059 type:complete len:267 (-) Transcript_16059:159-959(-)
MTPAPGAMCPSSSASSSSSKPYSSSTLSSSLNAAISKSLSSFLPFPFGCPSSPPAASAGGSFMSSWLSAHRKPEAAQAPRMSRMPVKEFGRPESSSPAAHIMTPSTTTTMLQMSNVLGFSRRKSSAKKSVKAGTVPLSIVYTLTVRWSSAAFDAATSKAVQKAMGTIPPRNCRREMGVTSKPGTRLSARVTTAMDALCTSVMKHGTWKSRLLSSHLFAKVMLMLTVYHASVAAPRTQSEPRCCIFAAPWIPMATLARAHLGAASSP